MLTPSPFALKRLAVGLVSLIGLALLLIWVWDYCSEQVFYLDRHKYSEFQTQADTIVYRSDGGNPVSVISHRNHKIVRIDKSDYRIDPINQEDRRGYQVVYPNGDEYTVIDQNRSRR